MQSIVQSSVRHAENRKWWSRVVGRALRCYQQEAVVKDPRTKLCFGSWQVELWRGSSGL